MERKRKKFELTLPPIQELPQAEDQSDIAIVMTAMRRARDRAAQLRLVRSDRILRLQCLALVCFLLTLWQVLKHKLRVSLKQRAAIQGGRNDACAADEPRATRARDSERVSTARAEPS